MQSIDRHFELYKLIQGRIISVFWNIEIADSVKCDGEY